MKIFSFWYFGEGDLGIPGFADDALSKKKIKLSILLE